LPLAHHGVLGLAFHVSTGLIETIDNHPTDLTSPMIEDLESPQAIWVKPDERFSDFSIASLFLSWNVSPQFFRQEPEHLGVGFVSLT